MWAMHTNDACNIIRVTTNSRIGLHFCCSNLRIFCANSEIGLIKCRAQSARASETAHSESSYCVKSQNIFFTLDFYKCTVWH